MAKSKSISIQKNNEVIIITYYLRGLLGMSDPNQAPVLLFLDVDNKKLGKLAREALSKSREISSDEFYKIFNSGEVQAFSKKLEQQLREKFGYKSKKALYKHMNSISVDLDNIILISPHHQDSLDGYTSVKDKNGEAIEFEYPLSLSDEEFGQKIKEAFEYCTSIYKK